MILFFWKYSNNVIRLLFPQKQEGSNKVIRKSSVATLFGVRNEELKAVEVMVVLSGDVKQSCWLDEHQRMKETWCFNSLDIIGNFVSWKLTPHHQITNLVIFIKLCCSSHKNAMKTARIYRCKICLAMRLHEYWRLLRCESLASWRNFFTFRRNLLPSRAG